MIESLLPIAPLVWVLFAGLLVMAVDALFKRPVVVEGPMSGDEGTDVGPLAAAVLAIASVIAVIIATKLPATSPEWITDYFAVDRMALLIDAVVAFAGAMACLLASGYLREHRIERGEFYVIVLFSSLGGMALGHANNVLSLFIALETLSLGVYGLVAFRKRSPKSAEAATKYFLLGSFASAILLFGTALLYGATGATGFAAIRDAIDSGSSDAKVAVIGSLLVLVGLLFKVSAVPFHMWAPDAYEGAPTPVSTFMAVAVKASVVGVLIRISMSALSSPELVSMHTGWPMAVLFLAALSMLVGNVSAIAQRNIKRMLAYSSITHAGFMLMGLVAAWSLEADGQSEASHVAIGHVLFYLMAYAVSNLLAFGALIWAGSYGKEAVTYEDLTGLGRRHPWVAVPFVLAVLSLLGFPPTAGFLGKYGVIVSSLRAGGPLFWVALFGVVMSAVSAYYYLRVIVFLFMKKSEDVSSPAQPMKSGFVFVALLVCAYFVVRMGVVSEPYLQFVRAAADSALS